MSSHWPARTAGSRCRWPRCREHRHDRRHRRNAPAAVAVAYAHPARITDHGQTTDRVVGVGLTERHPAAGHRLRLRRRLAGTIVGPSQRPAWVADGAQPALAVAAGVPGEGLGLAAGGAETAATKKKLRVSEASIIGRDLGSWNQELGLKLWAIFTLLGELADAADPQALHVSARQLTPPL